MDAHDSVAPPGGDPPDAGAVRCKMRRGDGSEWTVTDLALVRDGLRVSGYRYVRDRDAPSESRREVLDDELLRTDDRVWCLDRRGSVVWRLTSPEGDVDLGEASRGGALPGATGRGDARRPAGGGGALPGAGGGPIGG